MSTKQVFSKVPFARTLYRRAKKWRRKTYEIFGDPKYSHPSSFETQVIRKYFNFRDGFFIEAGANNGYFESNTYYLEKFMGWHGILVEGIPELYEQCKQERKHSYIYHNALVSHEFSEKSVKMHYAGLMSVVDGALKVGTEQEDQIKTGLRNEHISESYTVDVPARTLDSILEEFEELPAINFLSLDVEGYEADVLKGLSLEKFQPEYILVEARFFEEVRTILAPLYALCESLKNFNYLYKRK